MGAEHVGFLIGKAECYKDRSMLLHTTVKVNVDSSVLSRISRYRVMLSCSL